MELDPVIPIVGKGLDSWGKVKVHNSKKITTHPDIAHPRQSPWPTMKGIPCFQPVGKGCSGCVPVRCVETTLE